MKVYVLGSGRCGEKTLAAACSYMTNYSVTADVVTGENQIAISKHLIWSTDEFEDSAMFVHLKGDREHTAKGYQRFGFDELTVSRWAPLLKGVISSQPGASDLTACIEYVDTINTKIQTVAASRPHHISISTTNLEEDFTAFWKAIDAQGQLDGALNLFRINADLAAYLPLLPEIEETTS